MSEKIDLSTPRGHGQGCMGSSRFPGRIAPEDIRVGDKISVQVGDIERVGVVDEIKYDTGRRCFWTAEGNLITIAEPGYTFTLLGRPAPPLPTTPGAVIRITADASGVLSEPAYAMLCPDGLFISTQAVSIDQPKVNFLEPDNVPLEPDDVSAACTWELVYEPGAGS